jgi:hypothetical protein
MKTGNMDPKKTSMGCWNSPAPRFVVMLLSFALAAAPCVFGEDKSVGRQSAISSAPRTELWSLKPLTTPQIPGVPDSMVGIENPIDAFVRKTLTEKGLKPSPTADRQTLIRRLYFDLIGLPPSPGEVEAFVQDTDPKAYEKLVDRLLESPRHGERWARHWLDVVHYGETHGYDKDQPRPNAWPYRDYVIRSLNEDKPYSRFVQEQVAGDVLFPGTRDGFEALGFIAAGPWDLIGHAEVPESKLDGQVARHLDRDDMVVNTLQTFTSLTVQCAQCHNHKFDPISQEDYYSLQAVFAAVDKADQKYDPDPKLARTRRELEERRTALLTRKKDLDATIDQRAGTRLKDLDAAIAAEERLAGAKDAMGYHSAIEPKANVTKWVQVDLGQPQPLREVVLRPCEDDFNGIGKGFGFPVRFRVEVSDDPEFKTGVIVIGDFTDAKFPNPKLTPKTVSAQNRAVRYVRVTAVELAPRQDDYIFALAEVEVIGIDGRNLALRKPVAALDSIEAPIRWQKPNLTDGGYPGFDLANRAELVKLKFERIELRNASSAEAERETLAQVDRELATVEEARRKLPPQSVAYVAAVYQGGGAFTGTGAKGGKPRTIRVLARGNIQKPGAEVGPGTLSCVSDLQTRFTLPEGHAESARRAALARWLTDSRNPLTWRSIVNRVWQYHFGRGLVDTPNDFGRMGELPSHPELLDWLAATFRDGSQSLKDLHRLIVTSHAYQQTSASGDADPRSDLDSDNRWLWRANRRKLEAEAVRDAVLLISGKMDFTMGGPSFRDFVIEHPEHSPHYQYHLHDPEDPRSHRRSIYRFIVRSQQEPFMTVLDCADPSMQVARRNETASALQALSLLNNSLMLVMAKQFAARVEQGGGDVGVKVSRAFQEAMGRPATAAEAEALTRYAMGNGLPNLCRVLFNVNEFVFVD